MFQYAIHSKIYALIDCLPLEPSCLKQRMILGSLKFYSSEVAFPALVVIVTTTYLPPCKSLVYSRKMIWLPVVSLIDPCSKMRGLSFFYVFLSVCHFS